MICSTALNRPAHVGKSLLLAVLVRALVALLPLLARLDVRRRVENKSTVVVLHIELLCRLARRVLAFALLLGRNLAACAVDGRAIRARNAGTNASGM